MCTTTAGTIESAVSIASGNASGGNKTIQAIKKLATGQVGIGENMTGQELQEALDLIVRIPSMTNNNTMQMSNTQDNRTGKMKDGMLNK